MEIDKIIELAKETEVEKEIMHEYYCQRYKEKVMVKKIRIPNIKNPEKFEDFLKKNNIK